MNNLEFLLKNNGNFDNIMQYNIIFVQVKG